jgi:hypothetical protein
MIIIFFMEEYNDIFTFYLTHPYQRGDVTRFFVSVFSSNNFSWLKIYIP